MDWTTLDEKNNVEHYQVVVIRNQRKAAAMIPELMAIRESILIIDSLPDTERLERNELRADLVEDYERKVKEIGDLCDHDWQELSCGSYHMTAGDIWDDIAEVVTCANCGMNKMYLTAPAIPEPVTF